jgi:hypothetical protein
MVLVIAAAAACVDTPPMSEPEVESSHVDFREIPARPGIKVDVLVYIDDSVATAAYRDALATVPSTLAHQFRDLRRNWSDVRIAVTSNDGRMRRLPGNDDAFLVDATDFSYERSRNFDGTLEQALTSLLAVGGANEGPSQPLEAVRDALEGHSAFLRENSTLAVIIISGADDASPAPVEDYVHWFDALIGGPWQRRAVIAAVYPEGATRLDSYVAERKSGNQTLATPIDADLTHAFDALMHTQWSLLPLSCMEQTPVIREAKDLRYDCSMSVDVADELRTVRQCEPTFTGKIAYASSDDGPEPACWSLLESNLCQPWGELRFELRGYNLDRHPAFRFECLMP